MCVCMIGWVCALVFQLLCQFNWWRIHMCHVTYLLVWWYVCVYDWAGVCAGTHLLCQYNLVTHSYVWPDSLVCVTWLTRMCDMTRAYMWHDSFIYTSCNAADIKQSHHTHECVITPFVSQPCHTYECIISHMWMSGMPITHVNASVISRKRMRQSHVRTSQLSQTHEYVIAHMWIRGMLITLVNASVMSCK